MIPTHKVGIYRVVENLALELAKSQEINLFFSATKYYYRYHTLDFCLEYLKNNPQLKHIDLPHSPNKRYLYSHLNKIAFSLIHQIETSNSKSTILTNKVLSKILDIINRIIYYSSEPIEPINLENTDIFHSTIYKIPQQVKNNKKIKRILTVYDLIPILYRDFFTLKPGQTHFVKYVLDSLSIDDWAICISECTKNDLCNYKKIDPNRVFVTHLAADSTVFYPCKDAEKKELVIEKYNIPEVPYFLSLSTLEPRKNISHVIRCFLDLIQQQGIKDINLVLVGAKGWKYEEIFEQIPHNPTLTNRIIFTGYVEDEDLAIIYSNAIAFIYMSFYEGFGLPPLEAMQCGLPVITSNTSSLPEVVGNAGIMLDPKDSGTLSQTMLDIYKNYELRQELSKKSLQRSQNFSWNKCAQETIDVYKIALQQ